MVFEMSSIARGVEYYERNPQHTEPRIRAKAHALQIAYTNFMIPTLSWLLIQLAQDH
eukprot:CAMPEP_0204651096 /NCGR_PEP_ID=MMETSP0718-20130828/12681_1 /ASSEMBLY_ACC=CAM_ASM_000674 /TAXON_ID=230516 /ORGANISM="Chaetoceros curvisetus" /LENGTH=56 /DNA_ID=CAMNT_0051674721 /DNA_START=61 /DNA_END=228 /DNA_ORIENTATION=-